VKRPPTDRPSGDLGAAAMGEAEGEGGTLPPPAAMGEAEGEGLTLAPPTAMGAGVSSRRSFLLFSMGSELERP